MPKKKDEKSEELKKAEPKAEPKKEDKKPIGFLGGLLVVETVEKEIYGKKYIEARLENGTAKILNEQDLKAQLTKKAGNLVY